MFHADRLFFNIFKDFKNVFLMHHFMTLPYYLVPRTEITQSKFVKKKKTYGIGRVGWEGRDGMRREGRYGKGGTVWEKRDGMGREGNMIYVNVRE